MLVEPDGVELGLVLDAGVHLEHLSDGHGGIGGGRQRELHPQSPVLPLWRWEEEKRGGMMKKKRVRQKLHQKEGCQEFFVFLYHLKMGVHIQAKLRRNTSDQCTAT